MGTVENITMAAFKDSESPGVEKPSCVATSTWLILFKMLYNDKIHDIMIKIEFIQYERSLYDESILQSDV